MPLPIALGGKSVSAQRLAGNCPHPEMSDDNVQLDPVELYQTLAWGVCPKNEWLVRVTASYYDMMDSSKGHRETTMVEVRIQVSYLNRPLSPNYRETTHHLKMFDGASDDYPDSQPQVVVSEDRRNLAVLLFHPHQQSSAVVIFQLRKPRTDLGGPKSPIPVPSYCQNNKSDSNDNNASGNNNLTSSFSRDAPAVATHPRFVSIWGISTICSIPNVSPPMLLAACHDGHMVWLDVRSSLALATGDLHVEDESQLPFSSIVASPTCTMQQGSFLAFSSDGCMALARWQLESTTTMQQTLLKHASTGHTVTTQKHPTQDSSPESPRRIQSASPGSYMGALSPERLFSKKTGKKTSDLMNLVALPFGNNQDKDKKEATRRVNHMNQFVLKELQKKTLTGNLSRGGGNKSPARQLRRLRSSVGIKRQDSMKRTMQVEVVSTLTEPIIEARFGTSPSIICVVYPATSRTQCVAEIFSIDEMGNFTPIVDLSLSPEQVEEASSVHNSRNDMIAKPIQNPTSIQSRFGLDHDRSSDSFAISTIYDDQWIGCVWNWRRNVLGWTIQNPCPSLLWSRLYFGTNALEGSHLVYVESIQDKYIQARKQIVKTGLLSPPNSFTSNMETCSLLLAHDSVSFPDFSQRTASDVLELEWRVSTFPLNYVNAYGPPQIAAVGQHNGCSLAVASSYGVCILDSKYKWRQFGTPNEEKTFGIVAMTWWEGNMDGVREEDSEDLLVAIIQCNNGRQYLSCWSPKRLDLAHQLMEEMNRPKVEPKENSPAQAICWGIPLSKDVKASSLSLLAEPQDPNGAPNQKRRAVVVVSSSNMESCELDYAAYQLQVVSGTATRAETYAEQKPFSVMVKASASGNLKNGLRSVGPLFAVFLAGASFRFDLTKNAAEEEEFAVTLGVVRTPGGLEAISLNKDGKAWISTVIDADEVSKVWIADTVCTSKLTPRNKHSIDSFVWVIELMNEELFCWSAPYLTDTNHFDKDNDIPLSLYFNEATTWGKKGLHPPTLVCKRDTREAKKRFLLGILNHIGCSSDWMQQSSSGCQTDIALGHVPQSSFGCVLRAGQISSKLHRTSIGDFDTDIFASDFLETDIYGPGDFLMMPPAFVPSLYAMFLEAAYLRTELPMIEESKIDETTKRLDGETSRLEALEGHIQYRLNASPNKDAVTMALRLLILRSIEMLASAAGKHAKENSDKTYSSVSLTTALFSEIVDAVRLHTTDLQFASLFLEVGRQVEPSCLIHLFPLPAPRRPRSSSEKLVDGQEMTKDTARSVMELFSLCIEQGSLPASASALPLLGSRLQSRNYCDLLLARSIEALVRNTNSEEFEFDVTQEERQIIGDIFRFGIKLEDAARYEGQLQQHEPREKDEDVSDALYPFLDDPDEAQGDFSYDSTESTPERRSSLICMSTRRSSLLSYIVPSMFTDKTEEEEAIKLAATSFIKDSTDMPSLDFLAIDDTFDFEEDDDAIENSPDGDMKSVGGLVGDALLELCRSPRTDRPWKTMAILSSLLLRDKHHGSNSASAMVFTRAAATSQAPDFESIIPDDLEGHDDEGTERLTSFLAVEIERCRLELKDSEAALIVDLVLLLLQRLVDFPLPSSKHSALTSGLVTVALIAGTVSNQTPDLMVDIGKETHVYQCYENATRDTN